MAVSRPASAQEDRAALIDMLIMHGVDLAAENQQGDTPFIKAVRQGSLDSVKAILKHVAAHPEKFKSALLSKNKKGLNALHEAAIWGHLGVIDAMMESGIFDVNVKDDEQNTPLLLAGDRKRVGAIVNTDPLHAVKVLLSHGASVHAQNKQGQTPLHLPDCSIEYLELVLAKISSSDPETWNIRDSRGLTCILAHLQDGRPYHTQSLLRFVDKSLVPEQSTWKTISPDYGCLFPLVSIDAADSIKLLIGADALPDTVAAQLMDEAARHSGLSTICLLASEYKVPLSTSCLDLCRQPADDGQTILHIAATRNHPEGSSPRAREFYIDLLPR
jgi:hypothetical protein